MASDSLRTRLRNINKRDTLIGLIILVVIIGAIYYSTRSKPKLVVVPTPNPTEKIENRFNRDIPDGTEKADLLDISGGTGSGIATRNEILVDLPDSATGQFYQAWVEKDGSVVSLGKLRMAKGGWLIEYNSSNYPGYNKVIVSLEKTLDGKIETRVLEGSFK